MLLYFQGIGANLAEYYAKPGIELFLLARNESRLQKVKATCEKKGAKCNICPCDVTNKEKMAEVCWTVPRFVIKLTGFGKTDYFLKALRNLF